MISNSADGLRDIGYSLAYFIGLRSLYRAGRLIYSMVDRCNKFVLHLRCRDGGILGNSTGEEARDQGRVQGVLGRSPRAIPDASGAVAGAGPLHEHSEF